METAEYDDLRDDHDRCCCECGDYFDGTLEDDYCSKCFAKLPPIWGILWAAIGLAIGLLSLL